MALNDKACKAAKTDGKPKKLFDGGGLYLHVYATGSKLWHWKHRFNGAEGVYSIGPYPSVSLAEAREARNEAAKLLRAGSDPTAERRRKRLQVEMGEMRTIRQVGKD